MAETTLTLPPVLANWRPTLMPGTPEAELSGCICPAQTDSPVAGTFTFDSDCPVHTEAERNRWKAYLDMKVQL